MRVDVSDAPDMLRRPRGFFFFADETDMSKPKGSVLDMEDTFSSQVAECIAKRHELKGSLQKTSPIIMHLRSVSRRADRVNQLIFRAKTRAINSLARPGGAQRSRRGHG